MYQTPQENPTLRKLHQREPACPGNHHQVMVALQSLNTKYKNGNVVTPNGMTSQHLSQSQNRTARYSLWTILFDKMKTFDEFLIFRILVCPEHHKLIIVHLQVPGLEPEKEYEFRIAAVNKAGTGPYSMPSDFKKYCKYSGLHSRNS